MWITMSIGISIQGATLVVDDCQTAIVVPENAVQEAGYIKTYTCKDSGQAKHEFHALAQMAYFRFQDGEIDVVQSDSPLIINDGKEKTVLQAGLILYRDQIGELHVLASSHQNNKKLLEAAYRYCTRWVRLDI
jgi:hypothetical protein